MNQASSKLDPALLTKTELEWLLGNVQVSNGYERKMRHAINRKIQTFVKLEIPLLMEKGFDVTANGNAVTTGSNATNDLVAKTGQSEGRVNYETISEKSPKRDLNPRPKVYETFALPG